MADQMTDRSLTQLTRRRALAAAAPAATSLLAACAAPGQMRENRATETLPARSVPVHVWARNATDKAVFDQITPLVEQRYPHLNVTVDAPSNVMQKLVVALGSGDAPEAGIVNIAFFTPMVAKNAFLSLQPYIAKDRAADQELKQFSPPGIVAYKYKGELHAVPTTSESMVLWYNEDQLRQASLTPPHEIENDPVRWNWNTVLEYAQKLNRGRDQERPVFGMLVNDNRQNGWGNFVYSNGGRVISEDGTKMTFSEPPAVEAIQWVVDLMWRYDVAPQPATLRATIDRQLFAPGRLAMLTQGEFLRRYLFGPQSLNPLFKFNLAQIPFAPRTRKRASVFHALGLPLVRGARQPDAGWQYLTVFMTEKAQQFITDGWGSRGGHTRTFEPWLKSNAGGGPPANWAAITRADNGAIPVGASPYLDEAELYEPVMRTMALIYDNKIPVREGLQQIDREVNTRLQSVVPATTRR